MKQNALAIVQARMGSSRLPGKVLKDIAGTPMLVHVVERAKRAKCLNGVVVATTTSPDDDAIAELCSNAGYPCYRGSSYDVLDRYYQTARQFHATTIVRLTADCPVIDPEVVDHVITVLLGSNADFAANRLPPPWHRTYPVGLDVEACTFQALERAWCEADKLYQREHVMPYLYEQEGRFRVKIVDCEQDYGHLRWTVDTSEDLELVRQIFMAFTPRDDFSWLEVIALLENRPDIAFINSTIKAKSYDIIDERSGQTNVSARRFDD